jgi:hypothetical protein
MRLVTIVNFVDKKADPLSSRVIILNKPSGTVAGFCNSAEESVWKYSELENDVKLVEYSTQAREDQYYKADIANGIIEYTSESGEKIRELRSVAKGDSFGLLRRIETLDKSNAVIYLNLAVEYENGAKIKSVKFGDTIDDYVYGANNELKEIRRKGEVVVNVNELKTTHVFLPNGARMILAAKSGDDFCRQILIAKNGNVLDRKISLQELSNLGIVPGNKP